MSPPLDANEQAVKHSDDSHWTYLVELSATKIGYDNKSVYGGLSKFDHLRQDLTAVTADSSSQIIAMVPNISNGTVETYKIADGQFLPMGFAPSEGIAADTARLVSMAPRDGRVALIFQGTGNRQGVAGGIYDWITTPIEEFRQAIAEGLKASSRSQLDLVSLDDCSSGSAPVLAQLAPVAKAIVASEAPEQASETSDGQAIVPALGSALKDQPADGLALGERIVAFSQYQCQPSNSWDCGAETLALYDSAKVPAFIDALNGFGQALAKTLDNPGQRPLLETIVNRLPELPRDGLDNKYLTDLYGFTQQVLQAFPDGSDELAAAARRLLTAQKAMLVTDYSSSPNMNGVSVLLPADEAAKTFDATRATIESISTGARSAVDRFQSGGNQDPLIVRRWLSEMYNDLSTAAPKDTLSSWTLGSGDALAPSDAPGSLPAIAAAKPVIDKLKELRTKPVISQGDLTELISMAEQAKQMDAIRTVWLREARGKMSPGVEALASEAELSGIPGWQNFVSKLLLSGFDRGNSVVPQTP